MDAFEEGLVSIVTPVYNGEKYIHILLESVLNQTYDKIQMIIADDGSEDNTLETVESFRERFVHRGYTLEVVSGPHSCAAGAMCLGLSHVKGEFLIWPDGDDALAPESVEIRASFLNDHKEAKAVRSNRKYVDMETGQEVAALERTGNMTPHNLFFEILNGETFVCCGCYMLRSKEFFEIYPEKKIPIYKVGQNFQMLLPYMYKYICYSIDLPLYIVNRRADSHSSRILSKEEEYDKYRDYEKLIDDIVIISDIEDAKKLEEIENWKYNRQKDLYQRHGDYCALRKSYYRKYKSGLIGKKEYHKNVLFSLLFFRVIIKAKKKMNRLFFSF